MVIQMVILTDLRTVTEKHFQRCSEKRSATQRDLRMATDLLIPRWRDFLTERLMATMRVRERYFQRCLDFPMATEKRIRWWRDWRSARLRATARVKDLLIRSWMAIPMERLRETAKAMEKRILMLKEKLMAIQTD